MGGVWTVVARIVMDVLFDAVGYAYSSAVLVIGVAAALLDIGSQSVEAAPAVTAAPIPRPHVSNSSGRSSSASRDQLLRFCGV